MSDAHAHGAWRRLSVTASFIFWRSRDVVSRSEFSEAGKIRKVRCDSVLGLSKKTFFPYFVDFVSRCRHTHDPTRHGDWLEYHMRSSILIVSSLFLHKYACHNPHHTRIYLTINREEEANDEKKRERHDRWKEVTKKKSRIPNTWADFECWSLKSSWVFDSRQTHFRDGETPPSPQLTADIQDCIVRCVLCAHDQQWKALVKSSTRSRIKKINIEMEMKAKRTKKKTQAIRGGRDGWNRKKNC